MLTVPFDTVTDKKVGFRRIKTQSLNIGQQLDNDGYGFIANWVELGIPTTGNRSRYARFAVPLGFKVALDFRFINTSAELGWYHVYPQGSFTAGSDIANELTGFTKLLRNRQGSTITLPTFSRHTPSGTPVRITDTTVDSPVWGESSSASGNKSVGALASESTFLLLDGGQEFLLQMYNGGAGALNMQVELNMYILPDALVAPLEV